MKLCSECKVEKNEDQYDRKRGTLRSNCKSCVSKYTKQHYLQNKEYYFNKAKANRKKQREILRKYLLNYYSAHPCTDCGEADPVVLEFDHLKDKTRGISQMLSQVLPISRLVIEIGKCQVVCANCHKRRTAKKFGWYKLT